MSCDGLPQTAVRGRWTSDTSLALVADWALIFVSNQNQVETALSTKLRSSRLHQASIDSSLSRAILVVQLDVLPPIMYITCLRERQSLANAFRPFSEHDLLLVFRHRDESILPKDWT